MIQEEGLTAGKIFYIYSLTLSLEMIIQMVMNGLRLNI